jgi:hypothetical protein
VDFETPPWPKISQEAKDCVRQLLLVKPEARPTAGELLRVRHASLCWPHPPFHASLNISAAPGSSSAVHGDPLQSRLAIKSMHHRPSVQQWDTC